MTLARVLAVLAVLFWLSALWARPRAGVVWSLVDRSESMPDPDPAAAELATDAVPDSRRFVFGADLRPASGAAPGAESSALGAALRALRARMTEGDLLRIHSDGAATDALPPVEDWRGIGIEWQRPAARPQLIAERVPTHWPAAGALALDLRLRGADARTGALAIEAVAGLRVEEAEVVAQDAHALSVLVHAAEPPRRVARLRFAWEGDAGRAELELALAPASPPRVWSDEPEIRAALAAHPGIALAESADAASGIVASAGAATRAAQRAAGERGAHVVLLANSPGAWLEQAPAWRPFEAQPTPTRDVWLLLDVSGSMEGAPLKEARDALADWLAWIPEGARVRVLPFRAGLESGFDPRAPGGPTRVAQLRAFGPTDLVAALAELPEPARRPTGLVVVSDGHAEEPAEGFAGLGSALRARGFLLQTVAVGEAPDRASLAALAGEPGGAAGVDDARAFATRLREALVEAGEERTAGPVLAEPGVPWPLPELLDWTASRPRFDAAPDALALLRDASGACAAALRALPNRAWLVGLACAPEDPWPAVVATLLPALDDQRLERRDGWVHVRGAARGLTVERRVFEPVRRGVWRAGPFPPSRPVALRRGDGPALLLPPERPAEFRADAGVWQDWLARHAALDPPSGAGAWRLALALACSVAALGARRRFRAAGM